jgi:hypothetical protein
MAVGAVRDSRQSFAGGARLVGLFTDPFAVANQAVEITLHRSS